MCCAPPRELGLKQCPCQVVPPSDGKEKIGSGASRPVTLQEEHSLRETCALHGCSLSGALQGSCKLCSWWASWLLLLDLKPWEYREEFQRKRPLALCLAHERLGSRLKDRVSSFCKMVPVSRPRISQSFEVNVPVSSSHNEILKEIKGFFKLKNYPCFIRTWIEEEKLNYYFFFFFLNKLKATRQDWAEMQRFIHSFPPTYFVLNTSHPNDFE